MTVSWNNVLAQKTYDEGNIRKIVMSNDDIERAQAMHRFNA